MTAPKTLISREAQVVFEELRAAGIVVPTAQNYLDYREQLRADDEATVQQTLEHYAVEVEDIEIAGVSCKQQTPQHWSEDNGICVLYAYGGGYVSGGTYADLVVTLPLAQYSNARVVSVDYRLSPEFPYPAAQDDMTQVYTALLKIYDAKRMVVSGESAGGNLSVRLLQQARDHGLAMPCCAVLFSPWVDLASQGDSHLFNDARDPSLNNAWVDSAADMHANGHPLDDPAISPIHGDMHDLSPCIITTGSRDLLLSQCLRLAHKLRAAGVECDLRVWEGLWHVFEFYPIPEAEISIIEVAEFIKAHS